MPVFVNGLKELDTNPAAIIPVERYRGKLLLVCGEAEKLWPSCPMTDQIVARAAKAGAPAPVVLRYKDAGHAVMGRALRRSGRCAEMEPARGTARGMPLRASTAG